MSKNLIKTKKKDFLDCARKFGYILPRNPKFIMTFEGECCLEKAA